MLKHLIDSWWLFLISVEAIKRSLCKALGIGAATQTLNELLERQCYYLIATFRVEINS